MSVEHFGEKEKQIKEFDEKLEKEKIKEKLEYGKEKQKLMDTIDASKNLTYLKSLVEKWLISMEVAKTIVEWKEFNNVQIEEIMGKIDEIEGVENIDKILPKDLRITKEEYIKALEDSIFREKIVTKLNWALDYMYQTSWDMNSWIINISSMITLLNESLVKVQDHTIDIKRSLEEIDTDKNPEELNFSQKIMKFFKEIF